MAPPPSKKIKRQPLVPDTESAHGHYIKLKDTRKLPRDWTNLPVFLTELMGDHGPPIGAYIEDQNLAENIEVMLGHTNLDLFVLYGESEGKHVWFLYQAACMEVYQILNFEGDVEHFMETFDYESEIDIFADENLRRLDFNDY